MKDRIAKSVFWIVWSRGVLQGISLLSTLLVARLLNPADYGIIAIASIWTSVVSMLSELGLGTAIVQFQDMEEGDLNACFWLTMSLAGLGYAALFILAPTIEAWFATPRLSDVLRVVGLTLPLAAGRIVPENLLRKRLAFDKLAQGEILSAALTIPVVVTLAWGGMGVWALVGGALTTSIVQGMATFWFIRWWPGVRTRSRRLYEVLRFSLSMVGARMAFALHQQADTFVLGKVSGEVVLGMYSMAMQITMLPAEKISGMVNQLNLPVMATVQVDLDSMRAVLLRATRLVAWTTLPICVGLMVVAYDFVLAALGEKWLPIVPLIYLLTPYAVIRSLLILLAGVLTARYRASFLFAYNVALLVVMPVAFWGGAVWASGAGVAAAWVIVYPLVSTWLARQALREIDLRWRAFLAAVWPPIIPTLMMTLAVLGAQSTLSFNGILSPILRLTICVPLGALVYAAGVILLGGPIRQEIMEILGWVFRRGKLIHVGD